MIRPKQYNSLDPASLSGIVCLQDHINGFKYNLYNQIIEQISNNPRVSSIQWHNVIDDTLGKKYPKLNFDAEHQIKINFELFDINHKRLKLPQTFNNLLCSFNGSPHESRTILLSALYSFGYYNSMTCSKNHIFNNDMLKGMISHYGTDIDLNYFLLDDQTFGNEINKFNYTRFDHTGNLFELYPIIKSSFVHVVSETLATSYYPFITEKFLYSVISQGLFVTFGQPGWHNHLKEYYGFRLYDHIFDYSFDAEQNPITRVIKLLSMLSKFNNITPKHRNMLYEVEVENINYNYNHYMSGDYKKFIRVR